MLGSTLGNEGSSKKDAKGLQRKMLRDAECIKKDSKGHQEAGQTCYDKVSPNLGSNQNK